MARAAFLPRARASPRAVYLENPKPSVYGLCVLCHKPFHILHQRMKPPPLTILQLDVLIRVTHIIHFHPLEIIIVEILHILIKM